jgi:N-acetylmuramoyl-L-alanine amidase
VVILLSCLALGLAGCVTTPPEAPPEAPAPPAPPAVPVTTPPKPVVKPPATPPAVTLKPPVTNQYTNINRPVIQFNAPPTMVSRPVPTWTSLDRWAEAHSLGLPHRLSVTPVVTYAIGSDRGVMIVEIGSRDATWNGTLVHLGFSPEMIDDQVFVHGLDLEKNLAPLLCEGQNILETNHVIVIDPGHGGPQVGTVSVLNGRTEKVFTLDWAKRLAPLLEARGWQVVLTRTNDADIEVTNRVNFANAHHPALFISLHFNSSAPDHKQAGLETYCLTPTGMPSFITRGYPDLAYLNFPANAFDRESLLLAMRLQRAILHATGEEDRGVRRARFLGILRGQHCPCVLIEGGYLSNPHDAQQIENPEFREKLAMAVATAVGEAAHE